MDDVDGDDDFFLIKIIFFAKRLDWFTKDWYNIHYVHIFNDSTLQYDDYYDYDDYNDLW